MLPAAYRSSRSGGPQGRAAPLGNSPGAGPAGLAVDHERSGSSPVSPGIMVMAAWPFRLPILPRDDH